MIKITRTQKDEMKKAGILHEKRMNEKGFTIEEANYIVANREHCGRDKTYYVVEEYRVKKFLGLIKENPRNNKNRKNGAVRNDGKKFYKKNR